MKNVLILGGTGFLGSALTRKFIEDGSRVSILKRHSSKIWRINDIATNIVSIYSIELDNLENIFKQNKYDLVVHAATNYGRLGESAERIVEANLMLPLRLLELSIQYKSGSFLNIDTFYSSNYKYLSHYSLSKEQFKAWLQVFSEEICIHNAVACHIYGPNDSNNKFIPMMIDNLLSEVKEIPLTLGEQKRYFIYVDDLAEFCVEFSKQNNSKGFHERKIIANEYVSVRYIMETLKKLTKNKSTKLNFGQLTYRENEIMNMNVEENNFSSNMNWKQKYDLEEGLKKTIEWHKQRTKESSRG